MGNIIIKKIEEVVEHLEKIQRNITLEDSEFNKALEKFAEKAIVTIGSIDKVSFGFQIKSIVLKPESGENNVVFNPVPAGVSAYPELREQILPSINMTNLIFSRKTTAHRACFYIAEHKPEILHFLREKTPPSQALLLEYNKAVPSFIQKWLEIWKKIPQDKWHSDSIREDCLRDLSTIINNNLKAFEAHGIKSIIRASRLFPGALQVQNLNCVDYLSQSESNKEKLLWGYYSDENKCPIDLEVSGAIAFPDVSRTNFWWNMYMAKCSLNTDQYSLFCSNPSTRRDSYAGVVVISDLSSDCNKIPVALLAIDLIAGTLLSCVDRMTLAYVEKKRTENQIALAKADERMKQHVKMVASFGHDGKRPAETIATLLSKEWNYSSKIASLLANSLKERLTSYSRLSAAFEDTEKARETLRAEAESAALEEKERLEWYDPNQDSPSYPYLKKIAAVFYEESIGLFSKIAIDDAGRELANKLWGEGKQQEIFEYVVTPLASDRRESLSNLSSKTLFSVISRMHEKNILVSCNDNGYFVPKRLSGSGGKPTTPLLASVLHFVFAELFTNTLKYQWLQTLSQLEKIEVSLSIESMGDDVYLIVKCSPGYKPSTTLSETKRLTGLTSLKLALQACGTQMCEQELRSSFGIFGSFPWPYYENGSTLFKIGPISKSAFIIEEVQENNE